MNKIHKTALCRLAVILLAGLQFFTMPPPVFSQDEAMATYSLPDCPFEIRLPEAPIIKKNCMNASGTDQCDSHLSFTKVYVGQASMDISAKCRPAEKGDFQRFSSAELEASLRQSAGNLKMEEIRSQSGRHKDKKLKYASLTGVLETERGLLQGLSMRHIWMTPDFYIIWSGTLQGRSNEAIDSQFAKILRSAHSP